MSDPYDEWFTKNPDDAKCCDPHGRPLPCRICRDEHAEQVDEARREETP